MKDSELDFLLSIGYFRMQQEIFTCRYVMFDDIIYPVHWLRIDLARVQYGPKQTRLLRINAPYTTTIQPFVLTDEIETLYATYENSLSFDAPASVRDCLLGYTTESSFDTWSVEVRDGKRLIAVGIFDNGDRSIAGIMNFYDPDYYRQSLGKYLMLCKINQARTWQKDYYYPGYLVGNYPKFDYKLFPCQAATEVFVERSGRWLPFSWEIVQSADDS
jgi:leucyl-tRNA---protein transferase